MKKMSFFVFGIECWLCTSELVCVSCWYWYVCIFKINSFIYHPYKIQNLYEKVLSSMSMFSSEEHSALKHFAVFCFFIPFDSRFLLVQRCIQLIFRTVSFQNVLCQFVLIRRFCVLNVPDMSFKRHIFFFIWFSITESDANICSLLIFRIEFWIFLRWRWMVKSTRNSWTWCTGN